MCLQKISIHLIKHPQTNSKTKAEVSKHTEPSSHPPSQWFRYYVGQPITKKVHHPDSKHPAGWACRKAAGRAQQRRRRQTDSRRAADCVWSFVRGCGRREQLEELKLGGGVEVRVRGRGGGGVGGCWGCSPAPAAPTKSTGVAQLGFRGFSQPH